MALAEQIATDRYRQALEEIAAAGREADETGLPTGRFLTVGEAVAIAMDALANGQKLDSEAGR